MRAGFTEGTVRGKALEADGWVHPKSVVAPGRIKARARRDAARGLTMDAARDVLAGFSPGDHVFALTKGQFSMIDVAHALLERTGPAEVSVWTWCIADYEVQAVTAFIECGLITDFRLIADYSASQREMPLLGDIQARFGVDCIRITKTHAKILTVKAGAWRIVARGSMNLNANTRFEQFDVSDSAATYDMVRTIERELWSKAKPLPVSKVAHSDADQSLAEVGEDAAPWLAGAKAMPVGEAWGGTLKRFEV